MIVNDEFERPDVELVRAYREVAPATLGHLDNVRVMHSAIKPLFSRVNLVGPALTVRTSGLDYGALSKADEIAQPGDILVVDRDGDTEFAVIGEFRALKYVRMELAGCIVDGAVTDVLEIQQMRFPTFSRSISAKVARNIGREGAVGVSINCGGVVVNPGDLIVADDNGVAVVSHEEARQHLEHGLKIAERERNWRVEYAEFYTKLH